MKKILFFMVFIYSTCVFAQPATIPQALKMELSDKNSLQGIMETVYNYYGFKLGEALDSTIQSKIDRKVKRSLKQWNRWAYFMSSRTGPNGELVDINSMWQKNSTRDQEPIKNLQQSIASTGNWELVGPTNVHYGHQRQIGVGRMDRIVFHPTDADIYYVASGEGGLWRTTNGGSTYSCLTDHLPLMGVSGIVVDYNSPTTIYILTGNGDNAGCCNVGNSGYAHSSQGVFKSTDNGKNWKLTGQLTTPGKYVGYQLVQNPSNPSMLLAATSKGVFRTTDGGANWTRTSTNDVYHDVKFKPNDGSIAYCVGIVDDKMTFFYSTNNGASWMAANFDKSIDNANRCSIGVSPANDDKVCLICGPGSLPGGKYTGCFVSTDEGKNFKRKNNSPDIYYNSEDKSGDQSSYDNCIAVKPSDADIIITGGLVVFKSGNGGNSIGQITRYEDGIASERDDYIHPDVHAVAYNPLDNKLYACTDGGVYMSTNDGASWSRRFNGLATAQIFHMSKLDGSSTQFMFGNQDNGIHTRYSDNSDFTQSVGGDGFDMDFFDNTNNRFFGVVNSTVYKYYTEGLTDKELMNFAPNFFPSMAKHLSDDDLVFIGNPGKAQIHFYDLDGIDDITTYNIPASWYIRQAPSNTSRLYVAGEKSAFKAKGGKIHRYDGDGDWTRLDNKFGFPDMDTLNVRITCIAVHPTDHDRVWVSMGGFYDGLKVFYSNTGGLFWDNITGSLPNLPINSLVVDANGNLYAGGDDGVFYRGAGWADWKPFYNGLPRVPVTDLIITANNYVYASTFGRSAWRSELYSDCPTNLDISGTQNGQKFYEASGKISTTGKSMGGAGTEVFYRAGDRVDLKEGFEGGNASELKIYNGPCNSGIPTLFKRTNTGDLNLTSYRTALLPKENNMEFPFAYIRNWSKKETLVNFKIEIVKEGEVSLVLTNKEGTMNRALWRGSAVGKNLAPLNIPELMDQQCTVLLFHNDVLVHWQDLNSKIVNPTK